MRSVDPLGQTLRIFGGKERGEISSSFRNTGSRGCWIVRREIGKRGSDFLFVASFLFICFFILLFSICMHGFWNGNFLAITERLYFEIQKKIRNGRIVYFFFLFFFYICVLYICTKVKRINFSRGIAARMSCVASYYYIKVHETFGYYLCP